MVRTKAAAVALLLVFAFAFAAAGCASGIEAGSGGGSNGAANSGSAGTTQVSELHSSEYSFENFDAGAKYALYTIRADRTQSEHNRQGEFNRQSEFIRPEKCYVGVDFVVDVSKTQIIADGFGYAANPYGAVRVSSLSDGFDIGLERHLYVLGDDIYPEFKAYEDAELTVETDVVNVEVERRELTAREYLLEFSAPYALHARETQINAYYEEDLFLNYANALDELLKIHYFIPRGELYAKAEL